MTQEAEVEEALVTELYSLIKSHLAENFPTCNTRWTIVRILLKFKSKLHSELSRKVIDKTIKELNYE